MKRAILVVSKIISNIDKHRYWTQSYRFQIILKPFWRLNVFNSPNNPAEEYWRINKAVFIDFYWDGARKIPFNWLNLIIY